MGIILKTQRTHGYLPLQGFQWLLPVYHSGIWVYSGQNAPVIQEPTIRRWLGTIE